MDDRIELLVTGSRNWADPMPVVSVLHLVEDVSGGSAFLLRHGAARGLDQLAGRLAAERAGWVVDAMPADWRPGGVYDKTAGLRRNMDMIRKTLQASRSLCVGFPLPESRGTYHCLRKAKEAGLSTFVVKRTQAHDGDHYALMPWT